MIRLLTAVLLLASVGLAFGESSKPTIEERLEVWLKKYPQADLNGDGTLTKEEVAKFREAAKGSSQNDKRGKKKSRIEPTFADVKYGNHERQVFDLWTPQENDSGLRFPILVFYHGGGFVGGDKSSFSPQPYLDAGIACASVNYRFVDGTTSLADKPLQDSARALQTIRHRAEEFNIDSGRVAVSGSSAGAVITMWLGYSDDMANPDSDDEVAKESTRVNCIIPINGPTNLMPSWIIENIGGSESVHGSYVKLYGVPADSPLTPEVEAKIKGMSASELVSKDDPPTLLIYSGALDESLPLSAEASNGKIIHHPYFGKALKEKLDAAGVENELLIGSDPRGNTRAAMFLMNHFSMID